MGCSDMRRKIAVVALVVLVLSQMGALFLAATVEVEAQSGNESDDTEIISGLRDPDMRLVDRSSTGDTAVLTIEADTSKTIQVADIVAGADNSNGVGFVTFEPRSLDKGTNKVEIEATTVNGQHAVGVQGSGPQANIYIDAAGSIHLYDLATGTTALLVYAVAASSTIIYAWISSKIEQNARQVEA